MSVLIVLAAAVIGAIAGRFVARRPGEARSGATMALFVLAIAATAGTNASEPLIEWSLPFDAVDAIEAASYGAFGFSVVAGWRLAAPPALRWLFLLLVPVAMYEPLQIAWRLAKVLLR